MSQVAEKESREVAFVAFLTRFFNESDRGALAALRRGLGKPPGTAAEMFPYLMPWLPAEPRPVQEEAYFTVAALFAHWHQGKTAPIPVAPGDLGRSLRELVLAEARGKSGVIDEKGLKAARERVERRFVGLLNCHRDDLADHLRHCVSRLKSKDVPVDWARLLQHIQRWERTDRRVQRQWAKAFWAAEKDGPTDAQPLAKSDEETE